MRLILAVALSILIAHSARAQCTAPGCEDATAVVSQARATARAIITANAPLPTVTPEPTMVVYATTLVTVRETVIVTQQVTVIATPTPGPVATMQPSATATPVTPIYERDDLPAQRIMILAIGVVAVAIVIGIALLASGRVKIYPNDKRK